MVAVLGPLLLGPWLGDVVADWSLAATGPGLSEWRPNTTEPLALALLHPGGDLRRQLREGGRVEHRSGADLLPGVLHLLDDRGGQVGGDVAGETARHDRAEDRGADR